MKKTIMILALVITVLFSLSSADAKWITLPTDLPEGVTAVTYDDSTVVIDAQAGTIILDICLTFDRIGKKNYIDDAKKATDPKLYPEVDEILKDLKFMVWRWAFDYRKSASQYRVLRLYDSQSKLLFEERVTEPWQTILPKTNASRWLTFLKNTYNLK